ncbi:AAA family ATPase [Candidatus Sumerlaeota bacterium]|nr:AAA family ATPase [Candidatus Sumerlaeota bacterium]
MRRLPEDRSLEVLLRRGALEIGTLDDLAGRLARFHAGAEGGERISRAGSWKAVARNCRENFAQIESFEDEVPAEERADALKRARAHFLLALGKLAPHAERPCLVLVGGLPGTGKSRLADGLARRAGFTRVSTDLARKELAGIPAGRKSVRGGNLRSAADGPDLSTLPRSG